MAEVFRIQTGENIKTGEQRRKETESALEERIKEITGKIVKSATNIQGLLEGLGRPNKKLENVYRLEKAQRALKEARDAISAIEVYKKEN